MKKVLAAAGLMVLLAAGCNSASQQSTENQPVNQVANEQAQNNQQASAQPSADAGKVKSTDDAVNLLEAHASSEQNIAAGTDDSDLTSSDSSELNSMTEVPNAQ